MLSGEDGQVLALGGLGGVAGPTEALRARQGTPGSAGQRRLGPDAQSMQTGAGFKEKVVRGQR